MSWTSYPRRGHVLRLVAAVADHRLDGVVPMDVAGVRETFGDEVPLVAALQLRWHAHLARRLDDATRTRPLDRDSAAVGAWCAAADDHPGTRLVLDHAPTRPDDAADPGHDHLLLAGAVGRGGGLDGDAGDPGADDVGARLEVLARQAWQGSAPAGAQPW